MGHKVYISFKTEDAVYKSAIQEMAHLDYVDKSLNEPINSTDPDYILQRIRSGYLYDSTVTIFLIGAYGAENRGSVEQYYIKKELQASLYNSTLSAKSGILGIVLPSVETTVYGGTYACPTWVLQVMPMFFIVGGFANARSWAGAKGRGESSSAFVRSRLTRLGRPVVYFLGAWLCVDLLTFALDPGRISAFRWAFVVFVPLWFVGMYGVVCAAAPAMLWLHRRFGLGVVVALLPLLVVLDQVRMHGGPGLLGAISTPLVWVFVHQLGVVYAEFDLSTDRMTSAAVAMLGLVLLVLAVGFGGYDASMVATPGGRSNLLPTTAAIAFTGVFQVGLLGLVAPALRRLASRRNVWTLQGVTLGFLIQMR